MSKRVEFYFDYVSPWSYLAHMRLPALARRTGAEVVLRPVLLGGIFKATGNQAPAVAAKLAWMRQDLLRFAERHGIAFQFNPLFPVNSLMTVRGAIAAQRDGNLAAYSDVMFRAMWREGRNLADLAVAQAALAAAGLDPERFAAAIGDESVKIGLREATEAAVRRGIFGVPTFFVGETLFFGQDRLDFVEAALEGRA
jgi:2-hydroxychromene-2-carboxylate isomerase